MAFILSVKPKENNMVMIIFAAEAKGKSVRLPEAGDECWCDIGKNLVKKHLHQKNLLIVLNNKPMKTDEILQFALGLELGTYMFDKYQPEPEEMLEQIVLLCNNAQNLKELYKPYAALANVVRYARDIVNEPAEKYDDQEVFCEIKRLTYLGLEYNLLRNGFWEMSWKGEKTEKPLFYYAEGRFACAVGAAVLKALALQKQRRQVKIFMTLAKKNLDVNDLLAEEPIYKIEEKGGEEDIERCVFRLYNEILYGAEHEKR